MATLLTYFVVEKIGNKWTHWQNISFPFTAPKYKCNNNSIREYILDGFNCFILGGLKKNLDYYNVGAGNFTKHNIHAKKKNK